MGKSKETKDRYKIVINSTLDYINSIHMNKEDAAEIKAIFGITEENTIDNVIDERKFTENTNKKINELNEKYSGEQYAANDKMATRRHNQKIEVMGYLTNMFADVLKTEQLLEEYSQSETERDAEQKKFNELSEQFQKGANEVNAYLAKGIEFGDNVTAISEEEHFNMDILNNYKNKTLTIDEKNYSSVNNEFSSIAGHIQQDYIKKYEDNVLNQNSPFNMRHQQDLDDLTIVYDKTVKDIEDEFAKQKETVIESEADLNKKIEETQKEYDEALKAFDEQKKALETDFNKNSIETRTAYTMAGIYSLNEVMSSDKNIELRDSLARHKKLKDEYEANIVDYAHVLERNAQWTNNKMDGGIADLNLAIMKENDEFEREDKRLQNEYNKYKTLGDKLNLGKFGAVKQLLDNNKYNDKVNSTFNQLVATGQTANGKIEDFNKKLKAREKLISFGSEPNTVRDHLVANLKVLKDAYCPAGKLEQIKRNGAKTEIDKLLLTTVRSYYTQNSQGRLVPQSVTIGDLLEKYTDQKKGINLENIDDFKEFYSFSEDMINKLSDNAKNLGLGRDERRKISDALVGYKTNYAKLGEAAKEVNDKYVDKFSDAFFSLMTDAQTETNIIKGWRSTAKLKCDRNVAELDQKRKAAETEQNKVITEIKEATEKRKAVNKQMGCVEKVISFEEAKLKMLEKKALLDELNKAKEKNMFDINQTKENRLKEAEDNYNLKVAEKNNEFEDAKRIMTDKYNSYKKFADDINNTKEEMSKLTDTVKAKAESASRLKEKNGELKSARDVALDKLREEKAANFTRFEDKENTLIDKLIANKSFASSSYYKNMVDALVDYRRVRNSFAHGELEENANKKTAKATEAQVKEKFAAAKAKIAEYISKRDVKEGEMKKTPKGQIRLDAAKDIMAMFQGTEKMEATLDEIITKYSNEKCGVVKDSIKTEELNGNNIRTQNKENKSQVKTNVLGKK